MTPRDRRPPPPWKEELLSLLLAPAVALLACLWVLRLFFAGGPRPRGD